MTYQVEVLCRVEDLTVGTFETSGALSAAAMRNVKKRDPKRYPIKIRDGEQQHCLACKNPLWFKGPKGDEVEAIPGMTEILANDSAAQERSRVLDQDLRDSARRTKGN